MALTGAFLSGANVLLLDEPTNHLDARVVAALESALASFTGALLVVSHDPRFLRALKPQVRWAWQEEGRWSLDAPVADGAP